MHPTILCGTCTVALMWSVPGFAQSHTVRLRDAPNIISDASFTAAGVVQVYEALEPVAGTTLPANLAVSEHFVSLIESMLRTSPTFRRQSLRIGSAASLTVVIKNVPRHHLQGAPRARTQLTTGPAGERRAVVEVIAMRDHAELIAHELEHIIEQLDGIDLAARVTLADAGVRRCADGAFETSRAIRAGLAVAEEMRRGGK